ATHWLGTKQRGRSRLLVVRGRSFGRCREPSGTCGPARLAGPTSQPSGNGPLGKPRTHPFCRRRPVRTCLAAFLWDNRESLFAPPSSGKGSLMPSRRLSVAIVALWLAALGWLFSREVLPKLRTGEPPPFAIELVDEVKAVPRQTNWIIRRNGQEAYRAKTRV